MMLSFASGSKSKYMRAVGTKAPAACSRGSLRIFLHGLGAESRSEWLESSCANRKASARAQYRTGEEKGAVTKKSKSNIMQKILHILTETWHLVRYKKKRASL